MTHFARRDFLKVSAAAGGGLLIGWRFVPRARASDSHNASAAGFAPNAFVRIDPAGTITLIMSHTEFGQGIYTSASMLIAEELEVGLDQITLEAAPPNRALYTDPLLGDQATGGSTSTMSGWVPLRQAGAVARTLLIQAAASQWRVDPATCTAARGTVTHTGSGRSLSYGQLADEAARLPVPKDVKLKDPSQFTLIGHSQKRLDTPAKVNGTMQFGIDVQVPGMKFGTVAASPVFGGKLRRIDAAAARAVPGVRDVVQLDDVVAVIGDHMWAAITGLRAAAAEWDDGPQAHVSTQSLIQALADASNAPGVTAKSVGDADRAIDGAAKRLDAVYQLPFLSHAPMEPINTTIFIRPDGADVWVGTQVPARAQDAVMKVTGLKADQVALHNHYIGGAFGRRLEEDSVFQAARIAKDLGYPVKLVWTREEDIQHDMYRPYYYDKISAGLDAHGNIVGWSHRVTGSSVTARYAPEGMKENGKLDPDAVEAAAETPYDFPAQLTQYVRSEPAGVPGGAAWGPRITCSWWKASSMRWPPRRAWTRWSFAGGC